MFQITGKVYTFGIAVLLCTALVFLGCEDAGSSSSGPAAPAAPEVTVTAADGQVTLSWTAVAGAASYKVYQGTSDNEVRTDITETSVVITGLSNGTAYSFWVAAVNSGGSNLSAEVTATPQATAPAAPSVTATPADGQVTLSWAAVTGAASYKVYQGTSDNEVRTDITETSVVITGLSNGTAYSFWVAAVNSGGSMLSAEVTATPRAAGNPPAAPTGLTATAGVEEVVLAWTAVTGATSYKVYQGSTALEAAITTPSHTVTTGLTAGTSYSFTVSAVNSVGEGAQSSPAATATPTPAVPAGLAVTAGDTQVVLTWTASTNAGVSGYKIRQTVDSTDTEIDVSGMTTASRTVTGLTNGKQYSFTITAVAGSTESAQSTAVTATPLTAPVVEAEVADRQVTLSWTTVPGAESYKVYQGTNTNEILTDSTITGTSAVVTGLTNDQAYSFWVSAVSSSGSSQSTEVRATPVAPTEKPAAPTVTAMTGIQQVTLSWAAVAGAISYKVYQDSSEIAGSVSGLTHTVTGLTAGTSYSFTVSAVNSAGEGAQSSAATVTPTPPAVSGLAAAAGAEQVALTWTASTTTGVTGYKIRQTVDGTTTEIDVTGMSTASRTVSGLTVGKSYSFTIAAVAGSTESTQSTAVTAMPTPPAVNDFTAAAGAEQVVLTWTASSNTDVTGYKIKQTVDEVETEIDVSGRAATTHTASTLIAGKTYAFTIKAVAGTAESSSSTAQAIPVPSVPARPSGVVGVESLTLSWTVSANTGVTGYKIEQKVDDSTTFIDIVQRTTSTYNAVSLIAGKGYVYRIKAVAGRVESAYSLESLPFVPQPIGVPQNLRAVVSEDPEGTEGTRQQVVLSWSAVDGAASYKVYQDNVAVADSVSTTSHTIQNLTDGKSYSFSVSVVTDGGKEGSQSEVLQTCNFTDADGDSFIDICTLDDLARIDTDKPTRRRSYELVRNLDFSSQHSYAPNSTNWTSKTWRPVDNASASSSANVVLHGAGQNPGWNGIGPSFSNDNDFKGNFNGRGYHIKNLYTRNNMSGLFGHIEGGAVVRNIHVHANLYGTGAVNYMGGIAMRNRGMIIASSSSGTANGLGNNDIIGGLVGENTGTIAASYSTMNVDGNFGWDTVGGLVGINGKIQPFIGVISSSYATGTVTGNSELFVYVAGLVGMYQYGTIIASYATGVPSGRWRNNLVHITGSVTVTESYGYAGNNGEKALTAGAVADGSTNAGSSWKPNVWDFGTSSQSPRLKWVTGYAAGTFTCEASLLPAGQSCGGIIPGQPAR